MKPTSVNILGKEYQIQYCDKPSDVDLFKRDALWGQIDFWTCTIRIYDNGNPESDVLHTLIHEILHAITHELKITTITKAADHEEVIDLLALALGDTLTRNGWLKDGTE